MMFRRLATVLWWFGALVFVGLLATSVAQGELAYLLPGLLILPACWAACYIVSGSFWSPPKD